MTDLRLFNTPPATAGRALAGGSGGASVSDAAAAAAALSPAAGAACASGGDLAFGAGVWVEVAALITTQVNVCELDGDRLKARLGLINLGEARLAALKSEIVVEVTDRDGASVAADVVSSVSRESRGSARRKVTDADRLADVPKTAEALGAGVITPREAKKIADANKAAPIDEDFLLGAAQEGLPGSFDDAVRRHVNDQTRGMDIAAIRRRQRQQRRANINQRPDGMYSLYAEFDAVAGARVAKEISTRADKLWRTEDSRDRATPEQRTADALEQLIVAKNTKGKMPITQLSVFVDYDALLQAATTAGLLDPNGSDGSNGLLGSGGPDGSTGRHGSAGDGLLGSDFLERIRNPRLDNGTPLSVDELLALTCDAHILPAVFRNSTQPLWLGRRDRYASDGQRTALAKRDLGCVGCEAPPDRCQAHHIVHWAHGGPTDLDNLVLLCSRCHHHEVHTLGAKVVQDPAGRYRLEHPPGLPTRRSRNPSHWAAYTSAPTLTIRLGLPHTQTGPTPPGATPPDILAGAINCGAGRTGRRTGRRAPSDILRGAINLNGLHDAPVNRAETAADSAPSLTIRLPHALTGPTPAIPPDIVRAAINLDGLHDPKVPPISSASSTSEPIANSRRCPGGTNLEPGQRFQPRRRRGSHRPAPLACRATDEPTAATIARLPADNATDVPGPSAD